MPPAPAVGDHYRPADADLPPGVYRVVGVPDDVTLLRVADGDGRRVHGGAVWSVPATRLAAGFEPAPDPDAATDPVRSVRNALVGLYWLVRRYL